MLTALFKYQFLQNAVLAALLASVLCGVIGVIIIEKKLVMMSGGIAHASYGGVGLGYLLGIEPIIGAIVFALCSALGIGFVKRRGGAGTDVIIGLFWSLGMALGIFFVALMPGYPPDMSSYLFGNILAVTRSDLYLTAGLTAAVVIIITVLFDFWKAYLFDDEFAHITGVPTAFLEYLLLAVIAMSVVALIRVVGIILALAMLTAPAATASLCTKRLGSRMAVSALFGTLFCFAGLAISYYTGISSGATIVTLSCAVCLMSYGVRATVDARARKLAAAKQSTGEGRTK
jgi:zinc transport system permease protein